METLLRIATEAALEAGREIMRIYEDPVQDFGIERKADNSPLTLADKAAHCCIARLLQPTGIPVLSEEGVHLPYAERSAWHRLWVVDPLDGTKEFIKKNGEFTVNIALVEEGSPMLGVVFAPALRRLYTGLVEEGRMCAFDVGPDGTPVPRPPHVSSNGEAHRPFVVVASRSHLSPETEAYIGQMRREHHDVRLVSSGSSLKICLVAEGSADVYPRFAPTMEWDTAAGDAVARAARREVTDACTGQPLQYNKEDLHNPWFIVR